MLNPIVAKLVKYQNLSHGAIADTEAAFSRRVKIPRRAEIANDEGAHSPIWVLLEGWACRYVILSNGERQIIGLMAPGDFNDTRIIRLGERNFGTMAMTDVTIALITPMRFKQVLDRHRDVVVAFAKAQLADESIMQTWIANMARKSALQRMAHLLCEMVSRGSRSNDRLQFAMKLPFIQLDFADILGISPVHVNRILKSLRDTGLIRLRAKWLEIVDYGALAHIAEFDAGYLYYDESTRMAA